MNDPDKRELMINILSDGMSRARSDVKAVVKIERDPFPGSSSFSTERIRALLDNGEWLDVFFKDLDPAAMLHEAQMIRETGYERSRREILMYRDILPQLDLDTPVMYGYCLNPGENLYWLFLENTGPKRLSRLGDFSLWVAAARWAARLHAIDPGSIKTQANFLPSLDAEHFIGCARRIEGMSGSFDPQQRSLISAALDRYYQGLDALCAMPRHLIHGEYFGKNVMIRAEDSAKKIAVIDWETAAFGPRCVDLVSITAGRWTPAQRAAMCRSYIQDYEAITGAELTMSSLSAEMDLVGLYRALWWLGYWASGDTAHISRWLMELSAVIANIGSLTSTQGDDDARTDG